MCNATSRQCRLHFFGCSKMACKSVLLFMCVFPSLLAPSDSVSEVAGDLKDDWIWKNRNHAATPVGFLLNSRMLTFRGQMGKNDLNFWPVIPVKRFLSNVNRAPYTAVSLIA
jgi:hypothetical protein